MKKNDKSLNKRIAILYYFVAFCFYTVAIINFIKGEKTIAIAFLCLGSSNLCLGSVFLNKDKDNGDNGDKNE